MPVTDIPATIIATLQEVLQVSEQAVRIWMIQGGWLYLVRSIFFFIDCKLVNFVGYVYKYFTLLISQDMFNEKVTNAIVQNIYIFIGVIVFFRLLMIVIKYLVNPDLMSDAKAGTQALIQRVIIGMCGILFIPTIFDLAFELQRAIFDDAIIQQLIIPNDMMENVREIIDSGKGGKLLGTYVLSGFLSPSSDASAKAKNDFNVAMEKGDLSGININKGGFLGYSYEYEYFFLASTIVLGYVFYQILKYTVDLAVRAFKMLIYQILAPIAMVEYMINGSDDGVFKNWKQATLSTYCMLFVRVMALWFVMFVLSLMSGMNSEYVTDSLLNTNDFLLRAIIIIALIGFLMDLPKIVGQVFGLDLEQESSATGLLKTIGGAALAAGAAVGVGAFNVGKAGLGAAKTGIGNSAQGRKLSERINNAKQNGKTLGGALNATKAGQKLGNLGNAIKGTKIGSNLGDLGSNVSQALKDDKVGLRAKNSAKAVGGIIMGATGITKPLKEGYDAANAEDKKVKDKIATEEEERQTAEMRQNIKDIKSSSDTLKTDVEAALHVTDRDANGMAVNAELRTAPSDATIQARVESTTGGVQLQPQTLEINTNITPPDTSSIGGNVSLTGNVSFETPTLSVGGSVSDRTASTINHVVEQISNVTVGNAGSGVISQTTYVEQQVQQFAEQAATQVFNGTAAQNTMDIRQELVNNSQISSVNNFSDASSITEISQIASERMGVDQAEFQARLNAELTTSGVDRERVSQDDAMRAIEKVVGSFHQEVIKEIKVSPQVESVAKSKVNNGRNNMDLNR